MWRRQRGLNRDSSKPRYMRFTQHKYAHEATLPPPLDPSRRRIYTRSLILCVTLAMKGGLTRGTLYCVARPCLVVSNVIATHISPKRNAYLTKCSLPLYSPVCMASSYAEVVCSHKNLPTVDRPPPGDLVTEMTIQRVPSKRR